MTAPPPVDDEWHDRHVSGNDHLVACRVLWLNVRRVTVHEQGEVHAFVFLLGLAGFIVGAAFTGPLFDDSWSGVPTTAFAGAAGAIFSLQLTLIGLLLGGAGQHFRATADAANHRGEMLAIMKATRG